MELKVTIPDDARNAINLRDVAADSNSTIPETAARCLILGLSTMTMVHHDVYGPTEALIEALNQFRITHPGILQPKE